tara:strand:+ start:94 stop:1281 length:1188 start_codon:yes stop_codon:yes gene_type:complete
MGANHGHGKTAGANALIFAYDTGDTRNSYKGEHTTNLTTDTPSGTGWAGEYTVVDSSTKTFTIQSKQNNSATTSAWRTHYWSVSSYIGSYVTISADVEFISETDCTFQHLHMGQGNTGSYPYHIAGSNVADKVKIDTKPIEKVHLTWSGVINATGIVGFTQWINNVTANGANSILKVSNVQIEAKSHATQFVNGTRSVTEGLKDLTGNTSIDLTNAGFNSNAEIDLDGTGDFIKASSTHSITSDITLEAVFNEDAASAPHTTVICTDTGHQYGVKLMSYKNSNRYGLWLGFGSSSYVAMYAGTLDNDTTYHLVGSWNQSTGVVKVYLNGVLKSTLSTGQTSAISLNEAKVVIGADYHSLSYGLNGKVYVGKVYDKVLTAGEVKTNYNNYKGRFNI